MTSSSTITAGKAYVIISAIDRTKHVLATVSKNVDAAARKIQSVGTQLMMGAGFAGIGTALPIRQFARFEDSMLSARAKMQASEADYQRLTKLAQHYGETTSYTAQQVADSMVVMAQMGLKPDDVENSLGAILNAARATGTELPAMSDYILTAIRAFGGEFSDAADYADVMTAACNNSALNMEMLGDAMTYCAKPARDAGVNVRQLSTLIGFLANQGIRGSHAGTALRRMFTNLATQRSKLEEHGIFAFDEQGQFKNIDETIAKIREVASTMNDMEKVTFLKDIFGQYALASMQTLATDEYSELSAAIQNCSGVAQETADMMDSSLGGSFRLIWSAVERAGNAIGEHFKEAINNAREGIILFVQETTKWIEANKETVVGFAVGIACVGALGAAFLATGTAIQMVTFAIGGFHFILTASTAAFYTCTAACGLLNVVVNGFLNTLFLGRYVVVGFATSLGLVRTTAVGIPATIAAIRTSYLSMIGVLATVRAAALGIPWIPSAATAGVYSFMQTVRTAYLGIVSTIALAGTYVGVGIHAVMSGMVVALRSFGMAIQTLSVAWTFFPIFAQLAMVKVYTSFRLAIAGIQSAILGIPATFVTVKTSLIAAAVTIKTGIVSSVIATRAAIITAYVSTKAFILTTLTTVKTATIAACLATRTAVLGIPAAMSSAWSVIVGLPQMLYSAFLGIPALLNGIGTACITFSATISGSIAAVTALASSITLAHVAAVAAIGGIAILCGPYLWKILKAAGMTIYQILGSVGTWISQQFSRFANAAQTAWAGIAAAGSELWGNLKEDCVSAFSTISAQITNGDWTGAFETAVLAMRAVWSGFQRFFVTAWHLTALAFMDIWQSMRRGIQDARETIAKLVGWFMKIGMTEEQKIEFDKALADVQSADRNAMEQGFTDSKNRHEQAIVEAEKSNISIREKLAEHTKEVQDKAHAQAAADEFARHMDEQSTQGAKNAGLTETSTPTLENSEISTFETTIPPQLLSQFEVTAHILDVAQFGTIAAEKNFLENNTNLRNAELEKVNNEKKDKNIERTADGVEKLVELAEEEKDDVIY
ncbi:MAG: phage tail tape measure protein [Planctomycetia bacterium]|nr:phage tail tape measure protein [Planctomycetia bacterium]